MDNSYKKYLNPKDINLLKSRMIKVKNKFKFFIENVLESIRSLLILKNEKNCLLCFEKDRIIVFNFKNNYSGLKGRRITFVKSIKINEIIKVNIKRVLLNRSTNVIIKTEEEVMKYNIGKIQIENSNIEYLKNIV